MPAYVTPMLQDSTKSRWHKITSLPLLRYHLLHNTFSVPRQLTYPAFDTMADSEDEPKQRTPEELQMMETALASFDYKSPDVQMFDLDKAGAKSPIAPNDRSFNTLSELRDTNNRPVVEDKRYFIVAIGEEAHGFRAVDYEDDNKKRIVFNTKWHGGLHLKLKRTGHGSNSIFHIQYPGGANFFGDDYLTRMDMDDNDVILSKNHLAFQWMFEGKGFKDKFGHPYYGIWTETGALSGLPGGVTVPTYSIARAGYDKDYKWRSYWQEAPPHGFFAVKLQRVDYNE